MLEVDQHVATKTEQMVMHRGIRFEANRSPRVTYLGDETELHKQFEHSALFFWMQNFPEGIDALQGVGDVGKFDRRTGQWDRTNVRNVKWVADLGSMTHGMPVVAGGHVYIGTNNAAGQLERYPCFL